MERPVRHKKARLHGYNADIKGFDKTTAVRRLRRSDTLIAQQEYREHLFGDIETMQLLNPENMDVMQFYGYLLKPNQYFL